MAEPRLADDPDAANVWQDADGTWVYRASALGGCLKSLAAIRMGYDTLPPPEKMAVAFAQGHKHENEILARTQQQWGVRMLGQQQRSVELTVMPGVVIRGHVDEVGKHDSHGVVVVDAKAMREGWEWKGWDGDHLAVKWAWQQSVYAYALAGEYGEPRGKPLAIVIAAGIKSPDGETINRVESPRWALEPPKTLSQIKARVALVESWARRNQLPETCEVRQYPCPVHFLCDGPEPAEMVDDTDLEGAAIAYRRISDSAKEMDAAKSEARDRLVALMGAREKVSVGGLQVSVVTATRRNFDKKKLLAEHPEIDAGEYETTTEYTRLEVR